MWGWFKQYWRELAIALLGLLCALLGASAWYARKRDGWMRAPLEGASVNDLKQSIEQIKIPEVSDDPNALADFISDATNNP